MNHEFRISIAYDNHSVAPGTFEPAWGFACVVEGFGAPLLFDTGASAPILMRNLHALDIDPAILRRCVISHGDWDHFGGIWDVVERSPGIQLFLPGIMSETLKNELKNRGAQVVSVDTAPVDLQDGVRLTGEMTGEREELGLILETREGIILITGCAHPGIVAMTRRCMEITGEKPWLVMGGFHLSKLPKPDVERVVAALYDLGVANVAPCHCTGDEASRLFKRKFGEHALEIAAGTRITKGNLS